MPFTTDGRVHHSGIANEKALVEFLNTRSTTLRSTLLPASHTARHVGGTRTKTDIEILDGAGAPTKTISCKDHKTGTFDWLNSSAVIQGDLDAALKAGLLSIKTAFLTHGSVETVRRAVEELFATHLREMSSAAIRTLLSTIYTGYSDYVLVTDIKHSELVLFERRTNLPELRTFEGWTYFLKSTARAKTSAQIWRRSAAGEEVKTNLRMRLVLNNGVNALLGTGSGNKSSVPCIKIQQDNVAGFLAAVVGPVKEAYSASPAPSNSSSSSSSAVATAAAVGGAGAAPSAADADAEEDEEADE